MTNAPSAPPPNDLPDVIREKIRTTTVAVAEDAPPVRDARGLSAAFQRARDAIVSRKGSAGIDRVTKTSLGGTLGTVLDGALGAVRKVQMPVSPEVRGEIIERGKRAGLSIGAALDKIVKQMPDGRTQPAAIEHDPDLKTAAVARAVKQPSIFAPGHIMTAVLTAGVVHIVTTFAITSLGTGSAFRTLAPALPVNEMVVMPPLAPGKQILPYLAPDNLYAFCRFNLARGPMEISALLPEAGWSLALYTWHGDNFYATPGSNLKPITAAFVLMPASDRLMALTPGVRKSDTDLAHVTSPSQEGLLVIRAPIKGTAFEEATKAQLKAARCAPRSAVR